MNIRTSRVLAAGLLADVIALSGCVQSPGGGGGSRSRLYESVEELVTDSSAVAVVTVTDSREASAEGGFVMTTADAVVTDPVDVDGLAGDPTGRIERRPLEAGAEILIRQMGTPQSGSETSSYLEPGRSYLVFLTLTGLPEVPDTEFFVTGAVAGIYGQNGADRDAGDPEFVRLADDGDTLPATLTVGDLEG